MARATKHKLRPGPVNTNSGLELLNTNWWPRLVNTNWERGPVNTKRGPGPVNTNWKPGQRTGAGGQGQKQGQGNTNTLLITLGKQRDQESIALTSSILGSLYFPALALCLASRPGRGSQFLFTGPGS